MLRAADRVPFTAICVLAGLLPLTAFTRDFETVVNAPKEPKGVPEGRAHSEVKRADLERRLPRSAPDALRYEPGVFVQQSAHGQGSAFVRGMTGQQTLLLFDGIRLNNSTYRQGPNQYFFTLDSQSIEAIEVLRGGASTRFGSDAMGGVISARPIEGPSVSGPSLLSGDLLLRGATADKELGGRVELRGRLTDRLSFVGGLGGRRVRLLTSGGPVRSPESGAPADVPRFAEDGKTQLGTGFQELTADGRITVALGPRQRVTAAAYAYRQFDAPRTDQCAPAFARFDECLRYDEQFRTLVYGAWDGSLGGWAERARATFSWQQQHERRTHSRPASFVELPGRDDVDTLGLTAHATTAALRLGPTQLSFRYGADTYIDWIRSKAWINFTDIDVVLERSRGQYLDGSRYVYGGAFVEPQLQISPAVTARAGGRASWVSAYAPADPESSTAGISRTWAPLVAYGGIEWAATPHLTFLANVDRSFRAPNLDDLTSRQQTGPGFQFENANLAPELALTAETGLRVRASPVVFEAWVFRTWLQNAIARVSREAAQCPPNTPACGASWFRFQLVNADRGSDLVGVEAAASVRLAEGLGLRTTLAWTHGEGPNLAAPPLDPSLPYLARVPLSRIPPLNGTVELGWTDKSGLSAGVAGRWATLQDRLAVSDRSDPRIPLGGTPGFFVVDIRAGYRLGETLVLAAMLENVFDTAYRYHGSSVNGPGRGMVVSIEYAPL